MSTVTPTAPSTKTNQLDQPATVAGSTTIADSVITRIASLAAREVNGIHDLGGGAARAIGNIRNAITPKSTGPNTSTQGVSVEVGETQVAVDITLIAEYPVPLQDVADEVRSSVADAIETLTGMEVTEVNVTVNDVYMASEQDDADDEKDARVQ